VTKLRKMVVMATVVCRKNTIHLISDLMDTQ